MERKYVQSASLTSARYQPYTGVLEVGFRNGHVYQYLNVPALTYSAFMHAPSHGKFFNAYIRNHFTYRQVR